MQDQNLHVKTDIAGTYQLYLGAQYFDNPVSTDITYSSQYTIEVVDCATSSALAAASPSSVVKQFTMGSSNTIQLTELMTNNDAASCWGTCSLIERSADGTAFTSYSGTDIQLANLQIVVSSNSCFSNRVFRVDCSNYMQNQESSLLDVSVSDQSVTCTNIIPSSIVSTQVTYLDENKPFEFDPFTIEGLTLGFSCCSSTITYSVAGMTVTQTDKVQVALVTPTVGVHSIQIQTSLDGGATTIATSIDSIIYQLQIISCSSTLLSQPQKDYIFAFNSSTSHSLSAIGDWATSSDPTYCPITSCSLFQLQNDFSYAPYSGSSLKFSSSLNLTLSLTPNECFASAFYISCLNRAESVSTPPFRVRVNQCSSTSSFNLPPFFIGEPTQENGTFRLPEYMDVMQEEVYVQVVDLKEGMSYDQQTRSIQFTHMVQGEYTVTVRLSDASGMSSETKFSFYIERQGQEEEEQKQEREDVPDIVTEFIKQKIQKEEDEEKTVVEIIEDTNTCTAEIESISPFGEMEIKFNTRMKTKELNLTDLNNTLVDIYIIPSYERASLASFDLQTINFTWNVTSYEKDTMIIKLNFTNFAEISPGMEKDEIVFHIKDAQYFFISEEYLKDLDKAYWTLSAKVTKQMEDSITARSIMQVTQFASDGLLNAMVGTFMINIIFRGAMSQLVSFINSLQILIHLPLLSIIVPGNVSSFFKIMVPVVQFDIIDSSWTTELLFQFDMEQLEQDSQNISDQTKDLGYENHNAVLNLGSIGMFSFLYYLKIVLVLLPLKLLSKQFLIGQKLFENIYSALIFSEILEINYDGYFEIIISAILGRQDPQTYNSGEIASLWIGFYAVFVSCITPIVCLWVTFQDTDYLSSTDFNSRWGVLTNQINYLKSSSFSFIFIIRRVLFVLIAFKLQDYPCFQFQAMTLLNTFILIYSAGQRPLDSRLRNRLNIFNEFCIMVISNHLCCYTDAVQDELTKYKYGWSMIGFILLNMSVNLAIFFKKIGRTLYIIGVKYYSRVDKVMEKYKKKRELKVEKIRPQVTREEGIFTNAVGGFELKQEEKVIENRTETLQQIKSIYYNPDQIMAKNTIQSFKRPENLNQIPQIAEKNHNRPENIQLKPQIPRQEIKLKNPNSKPPISKKAQIQILLKQLQSKHQIQQQVQDQNYKRPKKLKLQPPIPMQQTPQILKQIPKQKMAHASRKPQNIIIVPETLKKAPQKIEISDTQHFGKKF